MEVNSVLNVLQPGKHHASSAETPFVQKARSDFRPIALVCMPWGSVSKPSLAMALLKGHAERGNFSTDLHYLNLNMANRIGLPLYERLADRAFHPEWFFSQYLFGPGGTGALRNLWSDIISNPEGESLVEHLKEACDGNELACSEIAEVHVPAFIDECVASVDWGKYITIGFTTTFAQSLSALALAARIKEKYPSVKIMFGGANVDSDMGLEFIRSFSWVDYVVHGEAEYSFPALLEALAAGQAGETTIPGVSMRKDGVVISGLVQNPPTVDLNDSPVPDYTGYIEALKTSGLRKKIDLRLYFESSRGCWWGAKHHCTFCGLNGTTMAFRRKDPERVYNEVLNLSSKYKCLHFAAADNILANDYFSKLLPRFIENDLDLRFFYEVKANLSWDQLSILSQSGVKEIQPGIESFSSEILKLMNKGVTAIQNVQLIKWCYELEIKPAYNLLYGFPGESAEDYKSFPELFLLLSHLPAPGSAAPVLFERFSPYHFERDKFGLTLRPMSGYEFIFPSKQVDLEKIAYFFEGEWADQKQKPKQYVAASLAVWEKWKEYAEHGEVYCYFEKGPDYLIIHDNRPRIFGAPPVDRRITLNEQLTAIYLFCDGIASFKRIHEMLVSRFGPHHSEQSTRLWTKQLVTQGLLFEEDDKFIALAVRRQPNQHPLRKRPAAAPTERKQMAPEPAGAVEA